MRRLLVLAAVIVLFGHLLLLMMTPVSVVAEEFRANVRVDSNIGTTTSRNNPSIFADNGNLYAVWEDNRKGDEDIFYTKSSNLGVSFLFDRVVNDNPGDGTNQLHPDVAAHDGKVYVVWMDGRAGLGKYEIYFARSTDDVTFSPSIRVSDSGLSETNPSIAVDNSTGTIYVAWASLSKNIRLARSVDNGQSFGPSVLVSDSTLYRRNHPVVAVDSTGKVFVAWSDQRLGTHPVIDYYDVFIANSTDGGVSFGINAPVNEVDKDAPQWGPSISIDGYDDIHITWTDTRNGNRDIYYTRSSDGSNFGENVIVNDPYVHPRNPSINHQNSSIAVHYSGQPIYVVWTDDRAGSHSVYLAVSNDGGDTFHTATSKAGGNYFIDSNFTFNGGHNSNEAVVLDNDNGIFDPGILDGLGSPDEIVYSGQANLKEDLTGFRIRYCDLNQNQVWDMDEDIVVDGGGDDRIVLYPRVLPMMKNPADNTTGNSHTYLRWDLRNDDSHYYVIEKNERMVVGWFDIANAVDETKNPDLEGLKPGDPISGVKIEVAYKTGSGYDGTNFLTWSQALMVENPFFQVVDTNDIEVYERIDLYALGVDTFEELEQLNISFIGDASAQFNLSINSMSLEIKRGLPDGYDSYDYLVYNGSTVPAFGSPLTNFSDADDLMFIDGSGNGVYDRGEPLLVTPIDVDPGGPISKTFEVLARGDGPHWDAVFDPFPLNDDLDNRQQEHPDIAIDFAGNAFIVWSDMRNQPLSDAIYFTTSAVDDVPPRVLECMPSHGTVEVSLNATMTFIFSEWMQSGTISYVSIFPETNGLWFWNWDRTNLTFFPDSLLLDNQTYEFSVSGGKDRSGNLLQSPVSCSFRTVEGPAISHTPPQGHQSVFEPIEITATISDNDTVVDATMFYKNIGETFFSQANMALGSGSSVMGEWIGQIPDQPFLGFLSYYIVATDGVGNPSRSPATGEYTLIIGDKEPPSLIHTVVKSASAGSEVKFSATATDNFDILVVQIYVKPMGSDFYNPPISMERVGVSDEFEIVLKMPGENGRIHYYIEVVDSWGNVVTSGEPLSPHEISITGAPIDIGAILVWVIVFAAISVLYLGMFIIYRKPKEVEEEEEEE